MIKKAGAKKLILSSKLGLSTFESIQSDNMDHEHEDEDCDTCEDQISYTKLTRYINEMHPRTQELGHFSVFENLGSHGLIGGGDLKITPLA